MAIDIYTSISHDENIAVVGALEFTKRGFGRFMSNSFKPNSPIDSTLIAIESVLFGTEKIANKYQSNTVYSKIVQQKTMDKIRKGSNNLYKSSKKRYEELTKEFNGNLRLKKN
ncbi:MAG: hypothetical protein KJ697_03430 [Nanoarchaeota archaeon]|nr:hypothetical protein [Nanoarchaeota archaeon]MBU4124173.1 hypothetical protein [Nanoarchaeota archaeon]